MGNTGLGVLREQGYSPVALLQLIRRLGAKNIILSRGLLEFDLPRPLTVPEAWELASFGHDSPETIRWDQTHFRMEWDPCLV